MYGEVGEEYRCKQQNTLCCSLKGFNSGVVLFNLEMMRVSAEYNAELTGERMAALSGRYLDTPDWSTGDQDWFTLLGWHKPHLVATLPCRFNVMLIGGTFLMGDKYHKSSYNGMNCIEDIAIAHIPGI